MRPLQFAVIDHSYSHKQTAPKSRPEVLFVLKPRGSDVDCPHRDARFEFERSFVNQSVRLNRETGDFVDVAYINPFIRSTKQVFSTMLKLDVTIGKPTISSTLPRYDVSGIIGMSGDVVGSVVLSFPTPVARQIVGKFIGQEHPPESEDFADAVGELVNMISGAAKSQFEGKSVSISCPSVIIGAGHQVARPSDTMCISIPCTVYCGSFSIDVAIRAKDGATGAAATVQAQATGASV